MNWKYANEILYFCFLNFADKRAPGEYNTFHRMFNIN